MFSAKHVGLGIALLNIVYTVLALINACVSDAKTADKVDVRVWIAVYSFNILLNLFLLTRMCVRDLLAIELWFSFTIALFVLCLLLDNPNHNGKLISAYIFVSLAVMLVVYIKLRKERADAIQAGNNVNAAPKTVTTYRLSKPRDDNRSHHTQNGAAVHEPLDIGGRNVLPVTTHDSFIPNATEVRHSDNYFCFPSNDIVICCDNGSGCEGGCDDCCDNGCGCEGGCDDSGGGDSNGCGGGDGNDCGGGDGNDCGGGDGNDCGGGDGNDCGGSDNGGGCDD